MSKACGNCATFLKSENTPILGGGNLGSGETICLECFRRLISRNSSINVGDLSLEEVRRLLADGEGVGQQSREIR